MPDDWAKYTTPLSNTEMARFKRWTELVRAYGSRDVTKDEDYDWQGWWKKHGNALPTDHVEDTYKRPNHATFSDESIYSTPETPGGHWMGNMYFSASQWKRALKKGAK